MSVSIEMFPEHERRAAFVAMVAHELRTPLTAAPGALELMAGGTEGATVTTQPVELVELARRNTARLLRLVEDCLDLQAAHDGTLQLARTPVGPDVLVTLAVADVERSRCGDTPVEQHCLTSLRIDADAARLARALGHLVENACSFAPSG